MIPFLAFLTSGMATAQPDSEPIEWRELSLQSLDGAPVDATALEGKAVLVVNVASKCGFTGQYEGLQATYAQYKAQGLEIVGVPCNQFGWQEPADNADIASFCRMTYGVEFTMLEKQSVNGSARSELYRKLIQSPVGGGRSVKWNFEKFLVGRDGHVIQRFGSRTTPQDPSLVQAVQAALASPATEQAP